MNKKSKLENILSDAENDIFGAPIDDYYYNHILTLLLVYKESDSYFVKYKHSLINRLKTLIKSEEYNATDFIDESIKMWEELELKGYSSKFNLSMEEYPLAFGEDFTVQCAICNYAMAISRKKECCTKCPIEWSGGSCHDLYFDWDISKTDEERKKYAGLILNEIKFGRTDK